MIRTLVDKFRLMVVGPNLMRLARMPREDMNQLLELGADDFILNGGVQPPSDSPSPQARLQRPTAHHPSSQPLATAAKDGPPAQAISGTQISSAPG